MEKADSSVMFRKEMEKWKSQTVTSISPDAEEGLRLGLCRQPYAFTEQNATNKSADVAADFEQDTCLSIA